MQTSDVPEGATEKETLQIALDNHRAIVAWKVDGITVEQGQWTTGRSDTSLFGIVKHLALVELGWFVENFTGADLDYFLDYGFDFDADIDAEWRPDPRDTAESVIAMYEASIARANAVIASASLDDVAVKPRTSSGVHATLRWAMVHMIEETARHAGHADILREMVDGTTGYFPPH